MATIMVVDDMARSRESVARLLQREGHTTICVSNGAEALASLKAAAPDLIVLDHMMPVMDGLTFLQNMRRFPKWRDVPVIMLTGIPNRDYARRANVLGACGFLTKAEVSPDQVLDRIRQCLAASRVAK